MKKKLSFLSVMLLMVGAGILLAYFGDYLPTSPLSPEDGFSVTFLDVGQADAALLRCGDHWMLIDGGGRESSQKIYTVLKERGITHLDLVIASHPHEDHIGGLSAAFQVADAQLTLCPVDSYDSKSFENLKRYAQEKSSGITVPAPGDVYALGDAVAEIIGVNTGPTENSQSIVVKITYGSVSFLFPGDLEAEYAQPDWDLSATVLKVSHHGSYTGVSRDFLARVSPKYAVLSLGADNPYGMPHKSALDLLEKHCQRVYRTDLQGDITITTDGASVRVTTEKTASMQEIFTPGSGKAVPEATIPATVCYIINSSSRVFHLPSCSSTEKMKDSNKLFSSETREALIAAGYRPCGSCKP